MSASRGHTMGRQQLGVQLARFLYAIAAFVALVAAAGAVAPLVTGAPGGCRVVITLGAPVALGRSGIGSPTQTSPGPSAPGLPAVCEQYLDLRLPALAGVVAVVLVLTTIRLGREPESWGLTIVVGATVGIAAALATTRSLGLSRPISCSIRPALANSLSQAHRSSQRSRARSLSGEPTRADGTPPSGRDRPDAYARCAS